MFSLREGKRKISRVVQHELRCSEFVEVSQSSLKVSALIFRCSNWRQKWIDLDSISRPTRKTKNLGENLLMNDEGAELIGWACCCDAAWRRPGRVNVRTVDRVSTPLDCNCFRLNWVSQLNWCSKTMEFVFCDRGESLSSQRTRECVVRPSICWTIADRIHIECNRCCSSPVWLSVSFESVSSSGSLGELDESSRPKSGDLLSSDYSTF